MRKLRRNKHGWGVRPISLPTLLLVAFIAGCAAKVPPTMPAELYVRDVSWGIHDTAAVRGEVRELALHRDGDAFTCSTCHEGFTGELNEEALQGEHSDLKFDHGLNLRCLNCHHPENSDVYVDHDGSEIPADQPTRLCAKCHGPHYREWTLGVHGRINGFWSAQFGEPVKLECVQCHDPHKPAFDPMEPQRAPVLTRFQRQSEGATSHVE